MVALLAHWSANCASSPVRYFIRIKCTANIPEQLQNTERSLHEYQHNRAMQCNIQAHCKVIAPQTTGSCNCRTVHIAQSECNRSSTTRISAICTIFTVIKVFHNSAVSRREVPGQRNADRTWKSGAAANLWVCRWFLNLEHYKTMWTVACRDARGPGKPQIRQFPLLAVSGCNQIKGLNRPFSKCGCRGRPSSYARSPTHREPRSANWPKQCRTFAGTIRPRPPCPNEPPRLGVRCGKAPERHFRPSEVSGAWEGQRRWHNGRAPANSRLPAVEPPGRSHFFESWEQRKV